MLQYFLLLYSLKIYVITDKVDEETNILLGKNSII